MLNKLTFRAQVLNSLVVEIRDIEFTLGVDSYTTRGVKLTRFTTIGTDIAAVCPIQCINLNAVIPVVGDIELATVYIEVHGSPQFSRWQAATRNLVSKAPVVIEYLDAAIAGIADKNFICGHCNAGGVSKLAGVASRFAPGFIKNISWLLRGRDPQKPHNKRYGPE